MPAKVSERDASVGNQACAGCHSAIYESYQRSSMAHASGPAIDGFMPAEFTHKDSGVHYRIYSENGRVWLSFDRPGYPEVRGTRELLYYIGSGRRGLTYLFETDGFLFESPVNWYANKSGNMLTFPIGVSVAKVIKIGPLPIRLAIQPQYMPVHPNAFGQKWNIQVTVAPVIPKLIKGNVLEFLN